MPKKYPPLTDAEVIAILTALGFRYSNSAGGHDFYKATHSGRAWKVTIDPKESPFNDFLLKSMISQSGYSRNQFYGATKKRPRKSGDSDLLPKSSDFGGLEPAPIGCDTHASGESESHTSGRLRRRRPSLTAIP